MQWLVEFMVGLVAMIAAAALSQFGLDLGDAKPRPEIRRLSDCAPASHLLSAGKDSDDPKGC